MSGGDFAMSVAETLEQMHKVITDHHQAIKDLQRLVSALDTRLDRFEYDPNFQAAQAKEKDIPFTCPECGRDFTQPCWVHLREHYGDHDPNAQAESRHGEPK